MYLKKIENYKKEKQRFKNWTVKEEDFDGDKYIDTIVEDGAGTPRIINGWTVVKSKYPERHMYTRDNPRSQDRRAQRDEEGNITNLGEFTKYGDYKTANRALNIQPDGHVEYAVAEMRNLKNPLTPYQKFTKVILAPFWNHYKLSMPKAKRMRGYGIVKKIIWNKLKSFIFEELEIEIPRSKEMRDMIEKQHNFKNVLERRIKQMIVDNPGMYYQSFAEILDDNMIEDLDNEAVAV